MDKSTSNIVKGIAILFMLWLHLFNRMVNVELCDTFINIDGTPLIYLLTKATNPVAFFLVVSGYGLYLAFQKGDKNRYKRIATLIIHYWVILTTFLILGAVLKPAVYPGSIMDVIDNYTTYRTTYNGEMWFLCPYIILALVAPIYFRLIDYISKIGGGVFY